MSFSGDFVKLDSRGLTEAGMRDIVFYILLNGETNYAGHRFVDPEDDVGRKSGTLFRRGFLAHKKRGTAGHSFRHGKRRPARSAQTERKSRPSGR